MDALAAYGSDDSSSGGSEAPVPSTTKETSRSNSSARNRSEEEPLQEPPSKRKRQWDHEISGASSNENTKNTNSQKFPPPSARLPPPSLRATEENGQQKQHQTEPSMIEWDTDYVSHHKATKPGADDATATRTFLAERLKFAYAARTNNDIPPGGRAAQLVHQHAFHNPRFLDNAAQQCGIVSRMAATGMLGQEAFGDFEFRIVALEEQSRIMTSSEPDA